MRDKTVIFGSTRETLGVQGEALSLIPSIIFMIETHVTPLLLQCNSNFAALAKFIKCEHECGISPIVPILCTCSFMPYRKPWMKYTKYLPLGI